MARFRKAVITDLGLALINRVQTGDTQLKFTKICTGSGDYGESDLLNGCTGLKQKQQEFPISSIAVVDNDTVRLRTVISNTGLQTGYYIKEIGLYAQNPDGGELLYSIAVAVTGQWDYLPAESEVSPATITLDTYSSVANASTVTIQGGSGAAATAEDLKELEEKLTAMIKEIPVIAFGPETTVLEKGMVLFVVDGDMPVTFSAAGFTNMYMGTDPPDDGEAVWAQISGSSRERLAGGNNIIEGKLTVSEEPSEDTVFLAKIFQ